MGKHVFVGRNLDIHEPQNIYIGDNTVVNKNTLLDGRGGKLIIGDNVDIAQDVNIWTLTHDINDPLHTAKGKPVEISHHSWIGARSTIMPGVKIGEGAVVGVMAVVTKDVLPKNVVAGIPAKVISIRDNNLEYQLNYHPWFR